MNTTCRSVITVASLFLALVLAPATTAAATTGRTYATPEEAVAELRTATLNADRKALGAILGPGSEDLENPDRVQGDQELARFSKALVATNHLVHVSETNIVVEIGEDLWPFPIPLVKEAGRWQFDADAGRDELLNRRIGRNELEVLPVMRQYVEAQREYASIDRDGDQVLEYAQQLQSSSGKHDGLYWPPDFDGDESPFGPLVALAQGGGYNLREREAGAAPGAFHGYYFKILNRQGKYAPGGKYDYIINGNMIGGFAMVAWPAEYGESGIMTFIVNQQGIVYQKDLGNKTAKVVKKMTEYDPDPSWKASRD